MTAAKKPPVRMKTSTYRCSLCRRTYLRKSDKQWIKSYCVKGGDDARLVLVTEIGAKP